MDTSPGSRALGDRVFGRKAALLPDEGILLVATDLQGNLKDYEALKRIYFAEKERGTQPVLALCGDVVHGPNPRLNEPGGWPDYLGTEYRDQSREVILDLDEFTKKERAFTLLGNHEHAHIGGPIVSKFFPDEAAVLDHALGAEKLRIHALIRSLPLIAVSRSGIVLTHGAPAATERDLDAFERLRYDGYEQTPTAVMYSSDTVGRLLWARMASPRQAKELLKATRVSDTPNTICIFGHDVVHSGYDKIGKEQICVSTSYGLYDENKVYLRLDLKKRYENVKALKEGREILPLYPEASAR